MIKIGNPFSQYAKKVLLCGSGELGKEVAIELIRLGIEVIAVDRYANAPAMLVAQKSYVISMLDREALREVILTEKPDYIVPEVEAIATDLLLELEAEGFNIVPNAKAVSMTMNRECIRRLAAEECQVPTSEYYFASSLEELQEACHKVQFPCVVKPIMSSSGRGQSYLKSEEDIAPAWDYACQGARGDGQRVIIEGFVEFDYEITLLTLRAVNGIQFLAPIGHRQEKGDYQESWQPQMMTERALERAKEIALKITDSLGGYGIYGVELFVKGDEVIFNEVSPRPHDTGMVTMISQNLSEFALHVRAFLGLPITNIDLFYPSASKAIVLEGNYQEYALANWEEVLSEEGLDFRFFGKPEVNGHRRVGVLLASAEDCPSALDKLNLAHKQLRLHS